MAGAAGDSELDVVTIEQLELPVMAGAFDIAPFVVASAACVPQARFVAADVSEVLSIEGEGEGEVSSSER